VHGDTALNVAARVGNKGLITLLLDAGADKAKANKLGLRPVDFGVEQEALSVAPAENVVSGLKTEMRPERKSRDVQKSEASS
jgi:regulatory protein SWI6